MAPLLEKFVLVKVDLTDRSPTNAGRPVAMKYGVRYLPDLRVLSADGRELGTIDPADVDDLIAQLTSHA
ncbi:MAG: hypothetical protein IT452_11380 [Planctomycetia bacterium]|nr:hypothetical protein [Planctomycetia bacterium]